MIEPDVFNVAKTPSRGEMLARTERELQVSICQLLEEQLAVSRHILAALGASGSVPSVELEIDSKDKVKPHVKVYDLDPDEANAKAQEIFDGLLLKYGAKTP